VSTERTIDVNRSTFRRVLVLGALLLVVPACGGDDVGLSAQTWTLTEVAGEAAVPTALSTLTFAADGTLNGNTGCNDFTTSYEVDGSSLTVTQPAAATLRACEEPLMNQETAVFDALAATAGYVISGSDLELIGESGDTLARYSAES
jgi:putative lipoprotein